MSAVAGNLTPNFNTTSEHVTVTEGSRAILPCSVEFLGDQSVIWVNPRKILISHGDRRAIDDHRISVERPYIKEWNLLIREVRHNDSGTYECRINTTPKQTKKVTLSVQVPPMIISEMSSDRVSLEEGETATLICNVTGIPQPNVTWYKRNSRKIDGKKERIGTEGEVLVIHNVSRMCDDIYECYVDNKVPPAVSKAIRVTVDYAPEVTLPNKRIGQILGKETILDCIISGNPQAVTEWRRNGQLLHKGQKYDIDVFRDELQNSVTLSLRIKDLEKSDYGVYLCVGSNYLGEDEETMTLYGR
nr:hypothetical protein BaRGS_005868 [Batillaria attramentaria]